MGDNERNLEAFVKGYNKPVVISKQESSEVAYIVKYDTQTNDITYELPDNK
jgi:hypothetical protein